jgi:hypothetical protein
MAMIINVAISRNTSPAAVNETALSSYSQHVFLAALL